MKLFEAMKPVKAMKPSEQLNFLTDLAKELGCYEVSKYVLEDNRFVQWSGSGDPNQHHYGYGGLMIHTAEVVELCFIMREHYEGVHVIDPVELYLAALFHDAGKMFDYEYAADEDVPDEPFWRSTEHKRLIHHISRSAIIWTEAQYSAAARGHAISKEMRDNILHAILAHHTKREHGSPVAPKTRVAWLLTLCDNISARMDDADTWDIIKRPQTF